MINIELLENGMILFDTGNNVFQTKLEHIKSINVFPPEPKGCNPTTEWKLYVHGEGYIVFEADTREEIYTILSTINRVLDRAARID